MKEDVGILLLLGASFVISAVKSSELTYNAALNRPAYQISVHTGTFSPNLANDGSRHTTYNTGTKCALSDKHTNPWWAVDLGRPTTVYRVYFTNVDHSSGAVMQHNFIVGLTNVHPNISPPTLWNYTLCGQYPGAVPAGATVILNCQDNLPPFRYLIVQFPATVYLHICELEVIAPVNYEDLRNVALNKNSFQVSTYTDEFGSHSANLANDGSRQTNFLVSVNSCAASLRATNPWWAVDLDDPTLVVRVDLTNRGDTAGYRSDNFIVGLTNNHPAVHAPVLWNYTLCGQYPGAVPNGATVAVQCTNVYKRGLRFRYVVVQFPVINEPEPLNICEIEVYTLDISYNATTSTTKRYSSYTTVEHSPTSTTETSATVSTTSAAGKQTIDEIYNLESNPFMPATMALSVFAVVLIIVAVILLIMLLKERADNKQSKHDVRQAAAGEGDGEDYATITTPDTSGYQELEMSRR